MDEGNCSKLIEMAMRLGNLGGAVVVDEGYNDEEIRVANETIKRIKGDKFAVVRGKIEIHGTSQPTTSSTRITSSNMSIARLSHG